MNPDNFPHNKIAPQNVISLQAIPSSQQAEKVLDALKAPPEARSSTIKLGGIMPMFEEQKQTLIASTSIVNNV